MLLSDFDYTLPERLIAQFPAARRDASRLMVLHRSHGTIEHRVFGDLPEYLCPDDCLVLNDTRVIPARLIGTREGSGGKMELLLLQRHPDSDGSCVWDALARPGRKARPGTRIVFRAHRGDPVVGTILAARPGVRTVEFEGPGDVERALEEIGQVPLPPYIRRAPDRDEDPVRYQTVYAKVDGAAAAPTAGLHFTEDLLDRIRTMGVRTAFVTLHVGLGTFAPVRVERVEAHRMHEEVFQISARVAGVINEAREQGGRVVAVGTTSVRVLETAVEKIGEVGETSGVTDLFIYPGYRFRAVDALVTNFHLPRSTLLMLTCAFAGRDLLFRAYREAIERSYRFYSYGDAMLVL